MLYRLGKKQEFPTKPHSLVVTIPNPSVRNRLINTVFKLKYTPYSISIDRTMEERNLYKKVLNERNEMQSNDHLEEWKHKIRGPP